MLRVNQQVKRLFLLGEKLHEFFFFYFRSARFLTTYVRVCFSLEITYLREEPNQSHKLRATPKYDLRAVFETCVGTAGSCSEESHAGSVVGPEFRQLQLVRLGFLVAPDSCVSNPRRKKGRRTFFYTPKHRFYINRAKIEMEQDAIFFEFAAQSCAHLVPQVESGTLSRAFP